MARFGRSLLVVVGVLLLAVGVAAAAYVGPGDNVRLPSRAVSGGSPVTVVGWRLLGYRDTTLNVVASASPGDVFVGAASPVDLDSYVAGSRVLDVRAISPDGSLSGDKVGPDGGVPNPAPADLTFWTVKASGAGEQRLSVPLTGDPVSVVIAAPSGSELTVGLGATVPGASRAALLVAFAGVLLLVVATLLSIRARRRRRREAAQPVARPDEEPVTAVERRRSAARLSLLAPVGCLVLTGCVALPQSAAAPTGAPTKLALSQRDLGAALDDYNARNNAAIAAMAKGAPETDWAHADTGVTYYADVVYTAVKRADGKGDTPNTLTLSPVQVYSPPFEAYPMWALVAAKFAVSSQNSAPTTRYVVFQRGSASDPWRMAVDLRADQDPPPPVGEDVNATATQADSAAGADLMKRFTAYMETGADPKFEHSDRFDQFRNDFAKYDDLPGKITCRPAVIDKRPEDAIRVVHATVAGWWCSPHVASRRSRRPVGRPSRGTRTTRPRSSSAPTTCPPSRGRSQPPCC